MSQHDGDTPMGDLTQDPPGSVGGASRLREERLRAKNSNLPPASIHGLTPLSPHPSGDPPDGGAMSPPPARPPSSLPRRSPRRSPRNHRAPSSQPESVQGGGDGVGSQGGPDPAASEPMGTPLPLFATPAEGQTPASGRRRTPVSYRGGSRKRPPRALSSRPLARTPSLGPPRPASDRAIALARGFVRCVFESSPRPAR